MTLSFNLYCFLFVLYQTSELILSPLNISCTYSKYTLSNNTNVGEKWVHLRISIMYSIHYVHFYFLPKSNIFGIRSPGKSCVICCGKCAHEAVHHASVFSFSLCVCPANTSLSVFVDTRAVLHCPNATSNVLVVTWSVIFRDNTSCIRAYRTDSNKTREKTCTDERISWDSRPDQNFALRINPVAITHEGYYKCEVVTPDGNFCHGHHLQVLGKEPRVLWYAREPDLRLNQRSLSSPYRMCWAWNISPCISAVPPKVTLSLGENGTTVCWAVAGKPAAQISWTPTGDCHTVEEQLGNDTVTVQSTCHWEDHQVSEVSCFVSHVTGNKSLSIEMNPG